MKTNWNSLNISRLCKLAILLFIADAYANPQTCTLNNEHVNLNHGGTTAGKTGMIICKNEDGKVVREIELKNGKEIGKRMMIDYQGNREEYTVNEKGNVDGEKKVISKDGTLLSKGKFVNGKSIGIHKYFYPSGKLRDIYYYEEEKNNAIMSVSFREDGSVTSFHCAKESLAKEDKQVCGWGKKITTKMRDYEVTMLDGKLISETNFDRNGKKTSERVLTDGKTIQKKFFETGELKEENSFKESVQLTSKEYFMNGKLSKETTFENVDKQVLQTIKTYYDDGRLMTEGKYFRGGRYAGRDKPHGEIKTYFMNGQLQSSEHYIDGNKNGEFNYFDDKGVPLYKRFYKHDILTREIVYDKGVQQSDFEYLPDGSRKL